MKSSEPSVRGEAALLLQGFPKKRPTDRLERYDHWPARDRALLREIVLGCLRRRSTLDAVASAFTKHVEPPVVPFLHVGLHQLLFLDRVPTFAAISETLKASEARLGRKRRAFLNAVLRRVAEARGELVEASGEAADQIHRGEGSLVLKMSRPVFPDPEEDFASYAAAQYGLPVELVQRWRTTLGHESALALFQETIRNPRVHFRRLPGGPSLEALIESLGAQGIEVEPADASDGFQTANVGAVLTSEPFRAGHLIVQGEAAARSIDLLGVEEGARVLDLCAAPGGKAAVLARRAGATGTLVLCDRDAPRLDLLRTTLQRVGIENARLLELPRQVEELQGFEPTHILVDAPCTNTGVLSRRVEARWAFRARKLPEFVARQRELLDLALSLAGPSTRVLYATCSLEPEENRGVVDSVASARGFTVLEERAFLPTRGADGGYAALMVRT